MSPILLLAGRLLLAGIFVFAGVAKLRDRAGTWSMLRAFGVGISASDAIAPVLPWIEIATAVALVPTITAWPGAIAAFALLAAFSAAIVVNLALGRRPVCRCFGSIGAEPIGPKPLVRNALFAAIAAIVIVVSPDRTDAIALHEVQGMGAALAIAALCAVLAAQAFFIWQILGQQGRMLQRIDALEMAFPHDGRDPARSAAQLPLGQIAPSFALNDLDGSLVTLQSLCAAGEPVALFFMHPTCGPCRALVPDVARWSREFAKTFRTVVISQGSATENREFLPEMAPQSVLLQAGHEVADAFMAFGTPAAVVVDADGRIASDLASGADAIAALFGVATTAGRASNGHVASKALAVGSVAPSFSARTTSGKLLSSDDLRGADVALVFWSPTCGFCRQAADDLVRWERIGGLKLVVLSSSADDDLAARGFRGELVIDDGMRVGSSFGATGTPMAVLVAPDGTIASEVAAGRDAIDRLLEPRGRPVAL